MFGSSVREWNASPETAKLASLRQTVFFQGNPFAHYSRELGMKGDPPAHAIRLGERSLENRAGGTQGGRPPCFTFGLV
jgi:hypothetical protein